MSASSATALIQQKMPAARSITGFLVRSGRCRRLLADGNDKEDLMQVGLLKLVQLANRADASPEQIAAYLFIAIKRQLSLLTQRASRRPFALSLDVPRDGEDGAPMGTTLKADDERDRHEAALLVEQVLPSLPARERQVIELRYGLVDRCPKSGAEVGRMLGLSRERVRQIESRALERLRQAVEDDLG